ncbi:MAG TPA: hypothetical protein P5038_11490 [Candidatus Paceibacterota bacterium]|nr:hypothetical protein [Candidatus Paceibacterota bacterium]
MKTRFVKEGVALTTLVWLATQPVTAALYTGNGLGTGVVGNGTLSLTDDGVKINAVFTKGAGGFEAFLVIYFDCRPGGYENTSFFSDRTDAFTKTISGYGDVGRSLANFPPGFTADYALALTGNSGVGGSLYELAAGGDGSFTRVASIDQYPINETDRGSYTFSIRWSDLGLTSSSSFRFQSTYIRDTGYRYLDTFEGLSGSAGFSTMTFTSFNVYPEPVPEPAHVALAIFGAGFVTVGVVRRAIRSHRNRGTGA